MPNIRLDFLWISEYYQWRMKENKKAKFPSFSDLYKQIIILSSLSSKQNLFFIGNQDQIQKVNRKKCLVFLCAYKTALQNSQSF